MFGQAVWKCINLHSYVKIKTKYSLLSSLPKVTEANTCRVIERWAVSSVLTVAQNPVAPDRHSQWDRLGHQGSSRVRRQVRWTLGSRPTPCSPDSLCFQTCSSATEQPASASSRLPSLQQTHSRAGPLPVPTALPSNTPPVTPPTALLRGVCRPSTAWEWPHSCPLPCSLQQCCDRTLCLVRRQK